MNERFVNEALHAPIAADIAAIPEPYRPETEPTWPQAARLSKRAGGTVREYGDVRGELGRFGVDLPRGHAITFEHPLGGRGAREAPPFGDLVATPTSSFRSVVAWHGAETSARLPPFVLKLSMDRKIGTVRRTLREDQVARGLVVSRVLDSVPRAHRKKLGLEWFPERCGAFDVAARRGWLLRELPPCLTRPGGRQEGTLVPAFSLLSRRAATGDTEPLLAQMIRRRGMPPEQFVVERLLVPYIDAVSYLLLEQGVETEPHAQNVLFGLAPSGELSGKIVLRDFSDSSVSWPLRLAKGNPGPVGLRDLRPRGAPFSLVAVASGHRVNGGRSHLVRAGDTVNRYGLASFVWAVNRALERSLPSYRPLAVEAAYLLLWQRAAVSYLGCRPAFRREPPGVAIDEALRHFLSHTAWERCDGHGVGAKLPASAEPLGIGGRPRRRSGRVYGRVETDAFDLFLDGPLPVFLRAAI